MQDFPGGKGVHIIFVMYHISNSTFRDVFKILLPIFVLPRTINQE